MNNIFRLCDVIRQTSFEIHYFLKAGHLEKIYENALAHRLTKLGLDVQQQFPFSVYDEDGTVLGDYFADLVVNEVLIVEVKACEKIISAHEAQLLGYLRGSRMEHGVLVNFGSRKLEVKKYILNDYPFGGDSNVNILRESMHS